VQERHRTSSRGTCRPEGAIDTSACCGRANPRTECPTDSGFEVQLKRAVGSGVGGLFCVVLVLMTCSSRYSFHYCVAFDRACGVM